MHIRKSLGIIEEYKFTHRESILQNNTEVQEI